MVRRQLALIGFFLLAHTLACVRQQEIWPVPNYPEMEPNETEKEAMLLEEGRTLEGTLDFCRTGKADRDVFFVPAHAGFVYRIEIETKESDFSPVVNIADRYLPIRVIYPHGNTRVAVDVYAPFESPLYLTITEVSPRERCLSGWEEGRYWVRITKQWLCALAPTATVAPEKPVIFDFATPPYGFRSLAVKDVPQGMVGIALESERPTSDKKMILVDCVSGEVVAGSDDLDGDSGKTDPYLYEQLGGARDLRLVVERKEEDFRRNPLPADQVRITLSHHSFSTELEPNDRFIYANQIDPVETRGTLDAAEKVIDGEWQADRDIFRVETTRGAVVSFRLIFGKSGQISASLWASSAEAGGYTLFLLRRVSFAAVAGETYAIDTFLPYTGTLYLLLQGRDMPYRFSYEEGVPEERAADSGDTEVSLEKCRGAYLRWSFPPFVNAVRIALSSQEPLPLLAVFDHNELPFLSFSPSQEERAPFFYLTRLSEQTRLLMAAAAENCATPSSGTAILSVDPVSFVVEEPDFTVPGTVSDAVPGTTYIGWIDTDVPVIENRWRFTPERDGTLVLLTTPIRERTPVLLDTVLRVYEDDSPTPIAENDDLIEWLPFHNESFLRVPVAEGHTYEISVKPFMDASSNIEAMNIHLHYGLDIRFE